MKNELTALDAYTNRVYRIIVLIIPIFCLCASTTITVLHFSGFYPDINETLMWIFDFTDVLYLIIGVYFFKTGFDADGMILKHKLTQAKYTMAVIVIIQWNGISYIWPFTDLWAYCLLFTIVEAFFFDVRLVMFSSIGISASMFISWLLKGERLMPAADEYYTANMTFRMVGIVLMLLSINIITYFGGKFLVEELEKYVCYDTLTHLLNRRSMDSYLQAVYKEANNEGAVFCLLMMDIDDFKKVNDTYGHDCGDEVLRYVAGTISTGVRKNDTVFRWGGEEILVLMRTDEKTALAAAERIRKDIEKDGISYRGEIKVSVTVTTGLSAYKAGMTIQQMMDDADKKLYYGKQHGKNQVVCCIPQMDSGE